MVSYKELGLVNTKAMFAKAVESKFAVPAYNFFNLEQLQAIMRACVETQSPVMLQISSSARKYIDPTMVPHIVKGGVEMMKRLAKEKGLKEIPIALHLDHGDTFELCKACIESGFSSVMIDASHHSFEENIRISKEVA
ncbi:MAG: fructose-bisphosphate aldolase class II, partial [Candidatus Omnitrophota bacterium]